MARCFTTYSTSRKLPLHKSDLGAARLVLSISVSRSMTRTRTFASASSMDRPQARRTHGCRDLHIERVQLRAALEVLSRRRDVASGSTGRKQASSRTSASASRSIPSELWSGTMSRSCVVIGAPWMTAAAPPTTMNRTPAAIELMEQQLEVSGCGPRHSPTAQGALRCGSLPATAR